MRKLFFVALISVLGPLGVQADPCVPCVKEAHQQLFASGEWPLPVRTLANFPIREIIGGWDLGEGRATILVDFIGSDTEGRHYVDIRLMDRTTGEILGRGPGRVVDNVVYSSLQMAENNVYMELKSFIAPKNTSVYKKHERVVYIFLSDSENHLKARFRVYKIF